MLRVTGVQKTYGKTTAVDNADLHIKKDRCTALIGPNGAGKTTLLSIITGLLKPEKGQVTLSGSQKDRREVIGYLPQFPQFYNWMTGREYIRYAGELFGLSRKVADSRAEELLAVTGLEKSGTKRIASYSGGMKQRLGIAQALVNHPELLILDEPVSSLDPFGRREVIELMEKLKKDTAILFSTHVLGEAEQVSDDVYMMKNGKIIMESTLADLKKNYALPVFLIETKGEIQELAEAFQGENWVEAVELDGGKLRIHAANMTQGRDGVLRLLRDTNALYTKVEAESVSLEDIFVKVMDR
ncbi:ABC transporter ATP-binding protein [Alkalicoccus saliphilus]|uniref:ABC transporter ATP-binding protein n=1 Tax=Alkalicoccus saliphilus TaxID=200989 RepID=A0A2T4U2V5_9BACI|nr:ABC transporter ATP-binding protein [Alkalicoccus saliphilus]PTL37726.1 ABC transporter ATP-binding protein [Alkalicoccus saliphilus]